MARTLIGLLIALGLLSGTDPATAQEPARLPSPPSERPIAPVEGTPEPGPERVQVPWSGTAGFFFGAEALVAFPKITKFSHFPTSNLSVTMVPELTLGYRLDSGSILFKYRFMETNGTSDSPQSSILGPANVHTRLQDQTLDIDYASRWYGPVGGWGSQFEAGVRLADWLTRSDAQLAPNLLTGVEASNRFRGGGPHAGMSFWRLLGQGLSLFARGDGAILWGDGEQTLNWAYAPSRFSQGFTLKDRNSGAESATYFNAQVGLSWEQSFGGSVMRLDAGYLYEKWWLHAIGKHSDHAFFEKINWLDHGPFLRVQLGF